MEHKFKNTYRIESTRLKNYDYASDGAYFITICTKNREHFFGEIVNGILSQTTQSKICFASWLDLPNHYPNCILDEFVIMPDHVHGIIGIQNLVTHNNDCSTALMPDVPTRSVQTGLRPVCTGAQETPSLNQRTVHTNHSLSEIIRAFKSFTARRINEYQNTPGQPFWQPRFYDRIIRDEQELDRVREYIRNNPGNWEHDKDNPEPLWI